MRKTSVFLLAALSTQLSFGQQFRSFSGEHNNPNDSNLGKAGNAFFRQPGIPPMVISNQVTDSSFDARVISNLVGQEDTNVIWNKWNGNLFETYFGQFVNHDLEDNQVDHSIQMIVGDVKNDFVFHTGNNPMYNPKNLTVFSHWPSFLASNSDVKNFGNSWLDLSTIYGLNVETATQLRTLKDGTMKLADYYDVTGGKWNPGLVMNLTSFLPNLAQTNLPISLLDEFNPAFTAEQTFVSGDHRAGENVHLAVMTVIWIRRHNYNAAMMKQGNPHYDDETLFQMARKITIAEYQNVVFNEYIPTVIGEPLPTYSGYNSSIQPETSTIFATSCFRYGHTTLVDVDSLDVCSGSPRIVSTSQPFPWNPFRVPYLGQPLSFKDDSIDLTPQRVLALYGGVDSVIITMLKSQSSDFDTLITDSIRNIPGVIDVFALDIERQRDNKIPDYATIRSKFLGDNLLSRRECSTQPDNTHSVDCFSLFANNVDLLPFSKRRDAGALSNLTLAQALKKLYGRVDKVDLFIGLLSETSKENALVGPTSAEIIKQEYIRKREGDNFFYLNNQFQETDSIFQKIKKITFREILDDVTGVTNMQPNLFKVPFTSNQGNPISKKCRCQRRRA